ncbi:cytochrome P450 71D95-like isoform X2 [Andrographis paniculata]|uniref:cytochrome P450 71D95-like isoform X2 n=1 Tax=Andrographis paniculata TaxID=175694 RepID=UPI0021E89467|nr:cytochrome P450 71D95-like isoform X2 [Andrographis paniculata]
MEILQHFNLSTLIFLFFFFLFLLTKPRRKAHNPPSPPENSPPSPPTLPILGHLHHLARGPPHRVMAKLADKYGAVFHLQLGEIPTVVISSRDAAKDVLQVHDPACADRPSNINAEIMRHDCSDIAFSPYGDYWRQMRKICTAELLGAKNVKSFGYIRRDEAACLIERIRSSPRGASIDLSEKLRELLGSIVCRVAYGKTGMDSDELIALMNAAHSDAVGLSLADVFPSSKMMNFLCWNKYRLRRMRRKLDAVLDDIVKKHKLKQVGEFGGEDIVDALLRVQTSGELKVPITDDNIKAIIFDMFTGGTETSSSTIDWAMAELMKNPGAMAKAQAEVRKVCRGKKTVEDDDIGELKYLKLVVKETLRLHPPIPLVPRTCRDECRANGYKIPLKTSVIINIWSLGRNPDYWDRPEAFLPERFAESSVNFMGNCFEYIPFGSGRRICPGIHFGLANVELPLALLLYHFDWKIPDGDDIDMVETSGLVASRKNGLFLVPIVYEVSRS